MCRYQGVYRVGEKTWEARMEEEQQQRAAAELATRQQVQEAERATAQAALALADAAAAAAAAPPPPPPAIVPAADSSGVTYVMPEGEAETEDGSKKPHDVTAVEPEPVANPPSAASSAQGPGLASPSGMHLSSAADQERPASVVAGVSQSILTGTASPTAALCPQNVQQAERADHAALASPMSGLCQSGAVQDKPETASSSPLPGPASP